MPPTSPNGSSAPSCVTGRWTPKYSRASGVAEASVLAYVGLLVYDVGFYMLFPYSHDCCDCISSLGLCTLVYSCFFESPKCLRCLRNRESSFYCCNGELSLTTYFSPTLHAALTCCESTSSFLLMPSTSPLCSPALSSAVSPSTLSKILSSLSNTLRVRPRMIFQLRVYHRASSDMFCGMHASYR